MKHSILIILFFFVSLCGDVFAQRDNTPVLNRGLVAVNTPNGVFCSWRILGEEYKDVTYNIYRDGAKLNDKPLSVSNFVDKTGSSSSRYAVSAIVRGKEQALSAATSVLTKNYLVITPTHDGKCNYEPNDATIADLDGDGEMELIVKFVCTDYHWGGYQLDATEFDIIEAYKLNGKRLWWIDCGPNMTDFQSNEINIACYDWDGDGKAECILRAADRTIIHMADGTTQLIGDPNFDSRNTLLHGSGQTFTHTGAEFLLYLNGETAKPFVVTDYPLKRLEDGETDVNAAWGDNYGHRSSKHFFGAPYFDGHKPSIFLARGIYARHKMIALDVDPATHQLKERWSWYNNESGSWKGQGYHNCTIADVDMDGRDEIVFGSMVIDDNGLGLSTSGLGHGDALHVGDFNPYVHGLEVFACNEDNPNNNYRDATTSKIYYRSRGGSEDGRAMCGNFTDDILGAGGVSLKDGGSLISCVQNKHAIGTTDKGVAQNFRIYWDGDLCEETFDYTNGKNTAGGIFKYGVGLLQKLDGSLTNNDSKGTPCLQADILGDWREEIVMRDSENRIRIYTTTFPTEWRNYTLLDDHQYRNAMVTQMNGYNQPPHVSYFLGEAEGITLAPPPLITKGRVLAQSSITPAFNDKHVLLTGNENSECNVSTGVALRTLTVNTPSWVQGCGDNDNIKYDSFTRTLIGKGFSGGMNLVKQGDGTLVLPAVTQNYSGRTDVWSGTLCFDGVMKFSPVWLNRFAKLLTNGGVFNYKLEAEYSAEIDIAGRDYVGSARFDTLVLNPGARLVVDLYPDGSADFVTSKKIIFAKASNEKFDVLQFRTPVLEIVPHSKDDEYWLPAGRYLIAKSNSFEGNVDDVTFVGNGDLKCSLVVEDENLYVEVTAHHDPRTIYWTGSESDVWDIMTTKNFVDANGEKTYYVEGDAVMFNDRAERSVVTIATDVAPSVVTFDNSSLDYEINGASLDGEMSLVKLGSGILSISNVNTFLGGTSIYDGVVSAAFFALKSENEAGSLGDASSPIELAGGRLSISNSLVCDQLISITEENSCIEVASGATFQLSEGVLSESDVNWIKDGAGTLSLVGRSNGGILHIQKGCVNTPDNGAPATIYLEGSSIADVELHNADNIYSYNDDNSNVIVPEGKFGTWSLDSRCNYKGTLSGKGTIKVNVPSVRSELLGDWSGFEGGITFQSAKTGSYDPYLTFGNTYGLPNADVSLAIDVSNADHSFSFGNLSGSASIDGSGNWLIGEKDLDVKFQGKINGGTFTKVGTGKWILATIQDKLDNKKTVSIEGGVLSLEPSDINAKALGNSAVLVCEEGTLAGVCSLGDVCVRAGGNLVTGRYSQSDYARSGIMHLDNLSLLGGKVSFTLRNFNKTSTSGTSLAIDSRFYCESGTIEVLASSALLPSSASFEKQFKVGNSYSLWNAESVSFSNNVDVILPVLPEGLIWDTSDLFSPNGVIRVAQSASVDLYIEGSNIHFVQEVVVGHDFSTNVMLDKNAKISIVKVNGNDVTQEVVANDGIVTVHDVNEDVRIVVSLQKN